ncbi:MAG: M23 family metallopeptidase [Alphaproteobacteria bacterium]|nr:M23 family metallopeptidase [Alphaproteobacteria bacterium]
MSTAPAARLRRRILAALFPLVLLIPAAAAEPGTGPRLELEGKFVQGGLVIGHTAPGSRITLDGKAVRQRADGRFLIGFGRDAKPSAQLRVRVKGGAVITRTLAIAKRRYRVQRITGLPPKMVTPPARVLARIRSEARKIRSARLADTDRPLFDSGFMWPAVGRISGVYGSQRILNGKPRRPHYGIDIAVPEGTPVRAAAAGVVRIADKDLYFTGGTVLIDHGYGLNSVYSHLATLSVAPGQAVAKGEVIGTVGATGRATGAHLDWRVNLFLTRLDPALLVPPMPKPPPR